MIFLGPILFATVFAIGALAVRRRKSAAVARRDATGIALLVAVFAVLSVVVDEPPFPASFGWMPNHLLALAPVVTALVAVVATGLAPIRTHDSQTFSRMMLLFALAEGFVASQHPLPLTILWVASAVVVWFEIRAKRTGVGWSRVFGLYQGVGTVAFAVGALLVTQGSSSTLAVGLVLLGIGLREGVVPGHSWFVTFVENAPIGVVVAFVAPQLGVYAHLELFSHYDLGLLGRTVAELAGITAVFAAILGVVQQKGRRALAYLILSQTGLVAFGLESHSLVGYVGAILNWQVLAISTSGLAMAFAALESRRGTLSLAAPSGDFEGAPRLGVAFLILGFGSVGFPLSAGFVAEDLLLQGTVGEFPGLGLAMVVATALNGITVLRAFFMLFTGTKERRGRAPADLSRREAVLFGLAILALVSFGIVPNPLTSFEGVHADRVEAPQQGHG